MEGLRKMYYNPSVYGVLPFRHNYTLTGEYTTSAFFLPAFKTVKQMSLYDHRGFITEKKGRAFFDRVRELKASDPQELITYCAEFCYNAEEAFSLEGVNRFNKVLIAELLTKIRALKQCPTIESGYLEYIYKNNLHLKENITGFRWIPNLNGKILILEHPLWTLPPTKDENGNPVPTPEKMKGLYVIGVDGIDIGASQTSEATKTPSDFCLIVMKRAYGIQGPLIVAIYKDRPNQISEAYKIGIKLAQYYNAIINIEATRMGFATWARDQKLLSYFMKRPRATLTDILRGISKQYGTPATAAIINHQNDLIAEFITDYYYGIWFEEILDLLMQYSEDNKTAFDIVASLGMACLADEELSGVVPKSVEVKNDDWQDIGYYKDEKGIMRYGLIPKKKELTITTNNWNDVDLGIRSSDPRMYEGYL